jgi:hypothetical protein
MSSRRRRAVSYRAAAANVDRYLRADGTTIWSLMQLERLLRPEAHRRRRMGAPPVGAMSGQALAGPPGGRPPPGPVRSGRSPVAGL